MPLTRAAVCTFVGLSDKALRLVEAATEPVPVVPLPGRGAATINRYDEAEVAAWWAARVAEARAGRLVRRTSPRPARRVAPARPAARLPFAVSVPQVPDAEAAA